jgi:hypothetical protein
MEAIEEFHAFHQELNGTCRTAQRFCQPLQSLCHLGVSKQWLHSTQNSAQTVRPFYLHSNMPSHTAALAHRPALGSQVEESPCYILLLQARRRARLPQGSCYAGCIHFLLFFFLLPAAAALAWAASLAACSFSTCGETQHRQQQQHSGGIKRQYDTERWKGSRAAKWQRKGSDEVPTGHAALPQHGAPSAGWLTACIQLPAERVVRLPHKAADSQL